MPASAPDLSTVTVDEMVDELQRRSHAFIMGMIPLANQRNDARLDFSGSRFACSGMAQQIALNLLTDPKREIPPPK